MDLEYFISFVPHFFNRGHRSHREKHLKKKKKDAIHLKKKQKKQKNYAIERNPALWHANTHRPKQCVRQIGGTCGPHCRVP